MKKSIILLLFVLIPLTYAFEDYNLRDSLTLELNIHSSVDIEFTSPNGLLDYAKISLNYVIKDSGNQRVLTFETTPDSKISDKIYFEWQKPKETTLDYSVRSVIETNSKNGHITKKIDFPIKSLPQEVYEYTKPTAMIDFNDDIKKLAATLSEGDDDLYSVVFKLSSWTNENIKYDLSSAGADAVEKSSWVLKNKVGVCDELTNLFISLCRSLGIPARFVTGVSYTNDPQFKSPWGLHGWAEVYFPDYGWVPFDATYGEFGFIDAGHIKLKDTFDSNKTSSDYTWQGRDVELNPKKTDIDVNVFKKGNQVLAPYDLSIQLFDDFVGFGSYNYVEAILENKNNYYSASSVTLSVPIEITVLDDKTVAVLLKPYEKKSVFWKIKVPDDLKNNYKYTFPVAVTLTQANYSVESSFDVSRTEKVIDEYTLDSLIKEKESINEVNDGVSFFCVSDKNEIDVLETARVTCTIFNNKTADLSGINICIADDCKRIYVKSGEEKKISFEKNFNSSGYKFLTISAKNSEISKMSFITLMALDNPKVEISELKYPERVKFDDSFKVSFVMTKKSYATPKNAEVTIYHNKNKETWKIKDIDGIIPFGVELKGELLKFNDNDMKVVVTYYDDSKKSYYEEKDFKITLDDTTLTQKIGVIINQVSLWIQRMIDK